MAEGDNGKTIGDLLYFLLSDWGKIGRLITLLITSAVFLLIFLYLAEKLFGLNTTEIKIGAEGHVLLSGREANGQTSYLFMIHPQDWQQTIDVEEGQEIEIISSGSVNIDLGGIVEKINKRKELEKKYWDNRTEEEKKNENFVPEQKFSKEDIESIKLERSWIDPNGFSSDDEKNIAPTYPGRLPRKVFKDAPLGALVGQISLNGSDHEPANDSEAFFVGKNCKKRITSKGKLYLTINDVKNYDGSNAYKMFFTDNVGFFWVKILVQKGK